jgi:hypothetical protein
LAAGLKAKILTEERHHVILKAVGHFACVRAGINFEGVCDPIVVESVVKLCGIDSQAVLIAYIE